MLLLFLVVSLVASDIPGVLRYSDMGGEPFTVSWDNRSLILHSHRGAQRSVFFSAGVHYPRFTPGQWEDLFLKMKADGFNMVQTYFFVNAHLPKLGGYPYSLAGPANLTRFLELAKSHDMFVNLRIGPYVCAEWSWGGYPYDLGNVPNLVSRSSNKEWEAFMSAVVLNVTRDFREWFADRGGPIMLAQVENELHTKDDDYVSYCGDLVDKVDIKIGWEMCNGDSAYPQTINSCNGGDCSWFADANGQNKKVFVTQPGLWTENWMGWFDDWGQKKPAGNWPTFDSTEQSKAKSSGIVRWFARGASHMNFYNWAGGTEFARNAGSSIVPMYYFDAPLASDNLDQGPERRHMKRTFEALAKVAGVILDAPAQVHLQHELDWFVDGKRRARDSKHVGFVYHSSERNETVAFLEAKDTGGVLTYNGRNYTVSSDASIIVDSRGSVVFSSDDVQPTGLTRAWTPVPSALSAWSMWTDSALPSSPSNIPAPTPPRTLWSGSALGAVIRESVPLEAVNITEYDSELAYYITEVGPADVRKARSSDSSVQITIMSAKAQAWTAFVNGKIAGTGWQLSHADGVDNITFAVDFSSASDASPVVLTLLSTSLGVGNGGGIDNGPTPDTFTSTGVKGVTSRKAGAVMLGSVDITSKSPWTHIVGSAGEARAVYTAAGGDKVAWSPVPAHGVAPPLTWLKATFTAPPEVLTPPAGQEVNVSFNVDVSGLSRGRIWINDFDLGRYWSKLCGSAHMCQQFYAIPHDLLLPGRDANRIVVLDEMGTTDISKVAMVTAANLAPPPPPSCRAVPPHGGLASMTACGRPGAVFVLQASGAGHRLVLKSNSKFCLGSDSAAESTEWVGVVPCSDASSQTWHVPTGGFAEMPLASASHSCLDVFARNASYAAPLDVYSCNGGTNQEFVFDAATGSLHSKMNSFCVGFC